MGLVGVPAERTTVTELATALGMFGAFSVDEVLLRRPAGLDIGAAVWAQLDQLRSSGSFDPDFEAGFRNGEAFLRAPSALAGRIPRRVEWTGGRRSPGDELVPADLCIDHVYLVSCKYLSRILHNVSPSRLFDADLSRDRPTESQDWYQRVAAREIQALYEGCVDALGFGTSYPDDIAKMTFAQGKALAKLLKPCWPDGTPELYQAVCDAVSRASAEFWRAGISVRTREHFTWRLLRVGSAPYFVLGSSRSGSMRLRIATPWEFRQRYEIRDLEIHPEAGGQPRVAWEIGYHDRQRECDRAVSGHVEIRWSHGRFGQRPEAKVYLDTDHHDVPGYFGI